jgi:hypothetical protein
MRSARRSNIAASLLDGISAGDPMAHAAFGDVHEIAKASFGQSFDGLARTPASAAVNVDALVFLQLFGILGRVLGHALMRDVASAINMALGVFVFIANIENQLSLSHALAGALVKV